ncbi:diablo homolog, mitochondrial-like [Plakobranchus ocellatus]|uniref:Direct IAP-binding protein with low pI n=1 Tax=Plakobranchus ocellatus TaxID=259542 RepID=A0AAV3Y2S6_9GAST|nr:diablo homolog, mitochondrial-like [Plakobranchus ocellatus]
MRREGIKEWTQFNFRDSQRDTENRKSFRNIECCLNDLHVLLSHGIGEAVGFTTDVTAHEFSSPPNDKKTFEPNDPRLRSHECLKNAAGLSVDSTSAVLSQTVYALSKIEQEYIDLMNVLVVLMEYQLQVLGHSAEEERIGDLIVETRHEINKVKQRKEDLHLLFASVEKLADATAEVAFAAGAEYASTSAGERLYSAQREVKRVQGQSEEAERRLHEAQARCVEVLSQHEEKQQQLQRGAAERAQQEEESARDDHEPEVMSEKEDRNCEEFSDLDPNPQKDSSVG